MGDFKKEKVNKLRYSFILQETIRCLEELKHLDNLYSDEGYLYLIKKLCIRFLPLFDYFENAYRKNREDIQELAEQGEIVLDFSNIISKDFLTRRERRNLYKQLFVSLNNQMDEILDNNLEQIQSNFADNYHSYKQTFLSYAYKDRGLTFIMFFYFYINRGYLYIDWMHSPAYPNGIAIKDSLFAALDNSTQLLFLYTPNCEIENERGDKTLKAWCSWEFGSFYARSHQTKYYLRLPNNFSSYELPDILDTFLEMHAVWDGNIIGAPRTLNRLYAPNESELVDVVLDLLIEYVSPSYESFSEKEYWAKRDRFMIYDLYNPKTKTALEFGLVLDPIKNKESLDDKKYRFSFEGKEPDLYDEDISLRIKHVLQRKYMMFGNIQNEDKIEIAIVLPTRKSDSLTKKDNELVESIKNYIIYDAPKNVKKVYLFFIDMIYQFNLGSKTPLRKILYREKDI